MDHLFGRVGVVARGLGRFLSLTPRTSSPRVVSEGPTSPSRRRNVLLFFRVFPLVLYDLGQWVRGQGGLAPRQVREWGYCCRL